MGQTIVHVKCTVIMHTIEVTSTAPTVSGVKSDPNTWPTRPFRTIYQDYDPLWSVTSSFHLFSPVLAPQGGGVAATSSSFFSAMLTSSSGETL